MAKKKKKKKKKNLDVSIGSSLVGLLMLWLALPVIAGFFKIGEPEGPKIYPKSLHINLYGLGHRAAGYGEPQASITAWLYARPWFYFVKPKPIPQEKVEAVDTWFKERSK